MSSRTIRTITVVRMLRMVTIIRIATTLIIIITTITTSSSIILLLLSNSKNNNVVSSFTFVLHQQHYENHHHHSSYSNFQRNNNRHNNKHNNKQDRHKRTLSTILNYYSSNNNHHYSATYHDVQHPYYYQKSSSGSSSSTSSSSTALSMALIPLSVNEMERLISSSGKPTPQQYQAYFGRTAVERYNRIFEGCIVALIGGCMSYFLSFVLGTFVATILGTMSFLWGILSPELKAYQRNWEFLGGRKLMDDTNIDVTDNDNGGGGGGGLYGTLWMGYVKDVCVVEDALSEKEYDISEFDDYTMETDELDRYAGQPYLIRLKLQERGGANNDEKTYDNNNDDDDSNCRELQIHARMSEEYLTIQPGMAACVLLLSTDIEFITLAALTDVYIADTISEDDDDDGEAVLVGDYPYLNRAGLEELFSSEPDLWNVLTYQQQIPKSTTGSSSRNRYDNEKTVHNNRPMLRDGDDDNDNSYLEDYDYDEEEETTSFQQDDDDSTRRMVRVDSKRRRNQQR